jgi:transcriptional regulator
METTAMYLPPAFRVEDRAALEALIRERPLATLVTNGADGPFASHLPMLLFAEASVLRGHLARANPHWRELDGAAGLAIFHGPDAYVTPSWYPSKAESGQVVPTWNYAVVHVRGRIATFDDPDRLLALVTALTDAREDRRAEPWRVADAPAEFVARQLKGIVGVELEIAGIAGKWKMSQNRAAPDRAGVAAGLRRDGDPASLAVADLVEAGER